MKTDPLNELLSMRDELISDSPEFSEVNLDRIENEQIRELRQIVLETTKEDCAVCSCT